MNIICLLIYEVKNFYFKNRTVKAKEKIGKHNLISEIWRYSYAPSNKIGNCTDLFRKLRPTNEKDFCDKYFQYAEEHKDELPITKRGLTYDEFVKLVTEYMTRGNAASGYEYEYDDYFNDALCHIITETYDGKIQEMDFMNFLTELGYECGYFDGKVDAKYGVDIKVTNPKNGKVSAIQIKPVSFFKSRRSDVVKDQKHLIHKYHNCLNDFGIKTYYAIYYKDKETGAVLWLKNGDGYRFKIDELFEYDVNDINSTFSCKKLVDDYRLLGD